MIRERLPTWLRAFLRGLRDPRICIASDFAGGDTDCSFEFGHAIFPSAAVSIETCVRYGCALGINWDAKFPAKSPFSWVDGDEQNRVWWAVVILDRVSRIGYPPRPFLTEDPTPETILPSDDRAWDDGVSSNLKP